MVSICLATFNGEKYIYDTLKSIQHQTYKDFEVIIVDDYSTDNTVNIIMEFVFNDNRFKLYINNSNKLKPYIDAHNKSYEYANGDLLFRIDQDKILHKDYIKFIITNFNIYKYDALCTYVTFFKLDNNLSFNEINYITDERMNNDSINFNANNLYYLDYHYDSWFNQASVIKHSFLLSHKECKFKFTKQGDILFWMSCIANNCRMVSIPNKSYMFHRIHDNNTFNNELYHKENDIEEYNNYITYLRNKIYSI